MWRNSRYIWWINSSPGERVDMTRFYGYHSHRLQVKYRDMVLFKLGRKPLSPLVVRAGGSLYVPLARHFSRWREVQLSLPISTLHEARLCLGLVINDLPITFWGHHHTDHVLRCQAGREPAVYISSFFFSRIVYMQRTRFLRPLLQGRLWGKSL